ncbi:MAG: hypothetical protein GC208_10750, partial [Alphaproteobacteria bacterium]|nr:hypothetical protein [Alphaproteobacteria bacterium]
MANNTTTISNIQASGGAYVPDTTAPRIASIERQTPSTSPTNADSVTWRVTFSEAVTNVGTADFSVSGTTGTVSSVTNPSGNAYDVTVSGGDMAGLDATVILSLAGGQDIADAAGNALSNTTPTGANDNNFLVDNTAPGLTFVTGMTGGTDTGASDSDRITNDTTPILIGSAEVNSTVTVTRLGAGALGSTTADGSGAWTFQVPSALPEGSFRFYARATDEAGNAGSDGPASLEFTFDTTAPGAPGEPDLTAGSDRGISDTDNTTNDRTPTLDIGGAEAGATVTLISSLDGTIASGTADGSGAAAVTPGSNVSLGNHIFTATQTDVAGNTGAASSGLAVEMLATLPPVFSKVFAPDSISVGGTATLTFTIDNAFNGVSATSLDFTDTFPAGMTVASTPNASTTCTGGTITGAAGSGSVSYSGGSVAGGAACTVSIDVTSSTLGDSVNTSGNLTSSLGGSNAATDTLSVVDTTAPRIVSIRRQTPDSSPTNADSVVWRVTFTEDVRNVGAADFAVAGTSGTVGDVNGIDAATYDVTISGGNMAGLTAEITLSLAGGQDIEDLASNALINPNPTSVNQNTYDIDNTAPLVASISFHDPAEQETTAEVLTWEIVFDELVRNISANDFAITGTTATISGFAQQGDATTYRVTISGGNLATDTVIPTIAFAGGQDITDLAGNALTNTYPQGTNDNFYSVDNDPPIVTDIFAGNNATVGSTLVTWFVSINEDQDNLTIDDFTLETSAGVSASDLQISVDNGTNVQVTANLTGSGTAQLKFNAGTDIVDAFGNGNGTNGFAPAYVDANISVATVDTVPPRLQSIERFNGTVEDTNADTLVWLVTFDTPVRNVDAADFAVTGTTAGLTVEAFENSDQPEFAGAPAPAPDPLSQTYRVTASGGDLADLDATVSLGLAGGASIADANGNALTETTATGTVQTYTVDNTAPLITGLQRDRAEQTSRDSVSWRIAFDSEMQNLSPDDFSVSGTTATVSLTAINALEHTVTISGGDLADLDGTVTLSIDPGHNLTDAAGNALTNLVPVSDPNEPSYTIDNTGPQLQSLSRYSPATSPTSADTLIWRLVFNELVANVSETVFSVAGTTGVITIDQPEDNIIDVRVSGGDLATIDGTVTLTLEAVNNITDVAGNALTNLTGSSEHTPSYVVDNAAPRIATIFRSSPNMENTNSDTLIWQVTFDEIVGNVDTGDFSVAGSTASVTAVNAVSLGDQPEQAGSPASPAPLTTAATYNVTVSGGDLDSVNGTVTLIPLTTGGVTDAAGNAFANAAPTGTNQNSYNLDNAAPTLTSILRQTPSDQATNADSLTWLATFSEAVSADAADFAVYG